jgi:hypothetical protein
MKEFFKEHKLAVILFVGFVIAAIVLGTVVNGVAVDPTTLN